MRAQQSYDAPTSPHEYAYEPAAPPMSRPWLYDFADSKWVRIFLTIGFVGGQWLTWWLFLYGTSNLPAAHASAMCGLGPCM